jgi:anaerobic magnesium-protoporphyrin IX monomethyl ester cyclase
MRIALVGAEFEENLAVRSIEGALRAEGHEVELVVFNHPGELDTVAARLVALGTELVGMSMVFTSRAREFAELATRARALGLRSHLVAGGHFAAFHATELLGAVTAIDSVVMGEGELILSELASHLGDPGRVRGLVWRSVDGSIVKNPPATKPLDLDELPPPTHKARFDAFLGLPVVNLLGSRGCHYACDFCSISAWHKLVGGPRLRCRTPASVAEEMADLYRRGARIYNFHDDNFLFRDPAESCDRVAAIGRELARRKVGRIAVAIKARPDSVHREVLEELAALGVFRLFLGIEAGTAASLRELGRGQKVSDNERALELVREFHLHACFNLLVLNPDSTLRDFMGNVAFLRRHPHHPMNFCRTEVYTGTPLHKRLEREGRLIGDFWGYDYRIADPEAELLFELMHPAFRERNYGDLGLHHRTMAVDYEHQLLVHFFGHDEDLRRRVRRFIVAVNLNTADHLERMAGAVSSGDVARTGLAASVSDFRAAIARDGARLGREAERLLMDIRAAARSANPPGTRPWVRKATAAGLVASLSVAAACKKKASTDEITGTQVFETIAQPINGDPAVVRQKLQTELSRLVASLTDPCRIEITVVVGASGQASRCTARDLDSDRSFECPTAGLVFDQPDASGRMFRVEFSHDEVAQVLAAARDAGNAATPPDAAHTYMHERTPFPHRR